MRLNKSYLSIPLILSLAGTADPSLSQPLESAADSLLQVEINSKPPNLRVDIDSAENRTPFATTLSGWGSKVELMIYDVHPYPYTLKASLLKDKSPFVLEKEDIVSAIYFSADDASNNENYEAYLRETIKEDQKIIFKKKNP